MLPKAVCGAPPPLRLPLTTGGDLPCGKPKAVGGGGTASSALCGKAGAVSALLSDEEASEAAAEATGAEGWKSWAGCEPALGAPNGLGGTRGIVVAAGLDLQQHMRGQ